MPRPHKYWTHEELYFLVSQYYNISTDKHGSHANACRKIGRLLKRSPASVSTKIHSIYHTGQYYKLLEEVLINAKALST